MVDICIIGSGIVGSLIAQKLSKYKCEVLVLEKDNDVGNEASSANSAIIHSGHDPKDNTLKMQLNRLGNHLWDALAQELSIDFKRVGGLVVAQDVDQEESLKDLFFRTKKRGIECELLDGKEARLIEPHLSDSIVMAMSLPSTAIITPWEASVAAIENAIDNGVTLKLNQCVCAIDCLEDGFRIHTQKDIFESRIIINCAGIYADAIYALVAQNQSLKVLPRKGEYFVLDRQDHPIVSKVIYPMPSKLGKGVLAVPTIHGNVLIGPNSYVTEDKESNDTTLLGLDYVKSEISKILKDIPFHKIIRSYSGLRASIESDDFVIEEAKDIPHFINCIGIDSPGLASAPAIAEYVMNNIINKAGNMLLKESRVVRKPWIILNRLPLEQRQIYVKENPLYGHIICRCEQVSEAEILNVIHRSAGAHSVKAIKHRCRPGAGRCQGGFCEPRIIEILARELSIDPTDVVYDSSASKLLYKRDFEDKQ